MPGSLILHHYDFSNYSEKVRLVLGLKSLEWRSVEIPATLPKPYYTPLTGGYRRAPSLQIGSDIFCDTNLIIDELERRFPQPTIYPGTDASAQRAFISALERWTDSGLTRNAINYISCAHPKASRFTPEFLADRAALLGKPEPGLLHREASANKNLSQLRPQLDWIMNILDDGRNYICGENMSLADCLVYHPLWVMDQLAERPTEIIPEPVRKWMNRVNDTGHGKPKAMTGSTALVAANRSSPGPPLPSIPLDGDPKPGRKVAIAPLDYGRSNPSTGALVSIDSRQMTIQHTHEDIGTVHVHFPRLGYSIRPVAG